MEGISFTKLMILDKLKIDDEPLDLILSEIRVIDEIRDRLRKPFRSIDISDEEIKASLKGLLKDGFVLVLDEAGREIKHYNIDQLLNSEEPRSIWFRLTPLGEEAFDKNFSKFWED